MAGGNKTIFVVDDDELVLNLLTKILEPEGYAVRTFACARECASAVSAQGPDCIVSDLQMPGMDGIQLIHALRASGCEVPVIIVTAAIGSSIQLDQARRAGAYRILPKPVSRPELLELIAGALAGIGVSEVSFAPRTDPAVGKNRTE
jgi:CheY-like chemotaxis protein